MNDHDLEFPQQRSVVLSILKSMLAVTTLALLGLGSWYGCKLDHQLKNLAAEQQQLQYQLTALAQTSAVIHQANHARDNADHQNNNNESPIITSHSQLALLEFIIQLAQQLLTTKQDPELVAFCLTIARAHTKGEPSLQELDACLSRDLAQLQAFVPVDPAAVSAELAILSQKMVELLHRPIVPIPSKSNITENVTQPEMASPINPKTSVKQFLERLKASLKSLVVIKSKSDYDYANLLKESRQQLPNDWQLSILRIELALLQKNESLYHYWIDQLITKLSSRSNDEILVTVIATQLGQLKQLKLQGTADWQLESALFIKAIGVHSLLENSSSANS